MPPVLVLRGAQQTFRWRGNRLHACTGWTLHAGPPEPPARAEVARSMNLPTEDPGVFTAA